MKQKTKEILMKVLKHASTLLWHCITPSSPLYRLTEQRPIFAAKLKKISEELKNTLGRNIRKRGKETIEYYTKEYSENGQTRLLFTQYLDAIEELNLGHKVKMQALMEVTAANPLFQVFKKNQWTLYALASQYNEYLGQPQPRVSESIKKLIGIKL